MLGTLKSLRIMLSTSNRGVIWESYSSIGNTGMQRDLLHLHLSLIGDQWRMREPIWPVVDSIWLPINGSSSASVRMIPSQTISQIVNSVECIFPLAWRLVNRQGMISFMLNQTRTWPCIWREWSWRNGGRRHLWSEHIKVNGEQSMHRKRSQHGGDRHINNHIIRLWFCLISRPKQWRNISDSGSYTSNVFRSNRSNLPLLSVSTSPKPRRHLWINGLRHII